MNHDEPKAPTRANQDRRLLPRYATTSLATCQEAGMTSSPAKPLLLPPGNPAHGREPRYDEQEIDGYTIAEAHAALEAFRHRRNA
jgi:hypothetical protein